MPGEPLEDGRTGLSYTAYIVEIRSIGGLSGSPVFVVLGVGRFGSTALLSGGPAFQLLGLETMTIATRCHSRPPIRLPRSLGLAVVTPISSLIEMLDSEPQRRRTN